MPDDVSRSRVGRAAAEAALVRVVHYYGSCPEFVVLGGLIPELLCLTSTYQHAGTTDIDVQVDLEIACGSVNAKRLEQALQNNNGHPQTRKFSAIARLTEMTKATPTSDGNDRFDLERFLIAQKSIYRKVLSELNDGRKESHWMWFIFPQFDGLGFSHTAKRYAIKTLMREFIMLNTVSPSARAILLHSFNRISYSESIT